MAETLSRSAGSTLVDELRVFARTASKEQFCARYPSLFLLIQLREQAIVVENDADEDSENRSGLRVGPAIEFYTDAGMEPAMDYEPISHVNVLLPIAKQSSNPYPDRISLGRARNCDIVVRDHTVSKLHAHFHVRGAGCLELVDVGSQNGTQVNGEPLKEQIGLRIEVGDQVQFGLVVARVVDAESAYELLRS